MALGKCGVVTNQKGWEMRVHGTPLFPVGCYHNDLPKDLVPCTGMRSWRPSG